MTFEARITEIEQSLSDLKQDVSRLKETLVSVEGRPLIRAKYGAAFDLNDRLNVLELRKELKNLWNAVGKERP